MVMRIKETFQAVSGESKFLYCSECGIIVGATFYDELSDVLCLSCLYNRFTCWNCYTVKRDVKYDEKSSMFLCGGCYADRYSK